MTILLVLQSYEVARRRLYWAELVGIGKRALPRICDLIVKVYHFAISTSLGGRSQTISSSAIVPYTMWARS